MGYDVTFHPISEAEIHTWYFNALNDEAEARSMAAAAGMDEFYTGKYLDTLRAGREADSSIPFDNTHGYFIAVVQGFFRRYHYIRGGALSFYDDAITPYTKPWSDIVPAAFSTAKSHNRIVENYMSGVYIPAANIPRLLQDLTGPSALSEMIPDNHPGEHLDILLAALQEAQELGAGLLEATEVVEPSPFDLNNSISVSNLFHCDTAGPLLYQKVALDQIAQLEAQQGLPPGSIDPSAIQRRVISHEPPPKKRGFFSRLFGKD